MEVFVAGATGAVGRRLVPRLVEEDHSVTGMTRSAEGAAALREAGATPAVADALDAGEVRDAVAGARPEVVIHQLTAIGAIDPRRLDKSFEQTNRLRTEGTDNLVAAARAAGARRLVAQSFTGWPYAREGGPVKTEEDPLDPDPPATARRTLAAIRHLESAVTGAGDLEGVVLRYGALYGPGTALSEDGEQAQLIRARRFPIVGGGTGVFSYTHVDDAAEAALAALNHGEPGIYNIVDDEPAPVHEWLPHLAEALGARPPRRVPAWMGRLVLGPFGVALMTENRGASNEKAKRELAWIPRWPSWREGFGEAL